MLAASATLNVSAGEIAGVKGLESLPSPVFDPLPSLLNTRSEDRPFGYHGNGIGPELLDSTV